MNRFISRRFLVQTSKAVHATFASPTRLASCYVAKRLECGVSRRFSLPNLEGACITNSSATTKAAGYAALQTLRDIRLRLGRAVLYRRFPIGSPANLPARCIIRRFRRLEALRYSRLEICATPAKPFTAARRRGRIGRACLRERNW